MSQKRQISFVVGTYAKLLEKSESDDVPNKFKWACVVIPFPRDSGVFLNLVDRVTFNLHESFAKVCSNFLLQKVSSPFESAIVLPFS